MREPKHQSQLAAVPERTPAAEAQPPGVGPAPLDTRTVYDRAIAPGEDIQSLINACPAGTVFLIRAGMHRLTAPLTPKSGNTFVGEPGAIISGSRHLTSFTRSSAYWVASGQTQQGPIHGHCASDYPRCTRPEDLYINDVLLRHVGTLAEVETGKWHFDYANDRIYLADDPTGNQVETTVARHAFTGNASHVRIANLVIEKFANPAQTGAIHGDSAADWAVHDNEIRFNHAVGIRIGHRMRVLNNRLHHNGQQGIGGIGDDVLVESNEIAANNTAGFEWEWEAGGAKFVSTNRLVVRRNFVHHNGGPGLWTDIDNYDSIIEENLVEDNSKMGIFHEISWKAVIRNNIVRRNATGESKWWLYGAGILVSSSKDVEVYGNTVENNFNGISAVQQARGSGRFGVHRVENLSVHHNTIVQPRGYAAGLAQDIGDTSYYTRRNNSFTANTYLLGPVTTHPRPFGWADGDRTVEQWQAYGHDMTGSFVR